MFNKKDSLGVYPESKLCINSDVAYCLTFYDWSNLVGTEWIEIAKNIFSEFGENIYEGTGNLGSQHTHGQFNRVQKKLVSFLDKLKNSNNEFNFDVRLLSEKYKENDAFFPGNIEIVIGVKSSGKKNGLIAIRENKIGSLDQMVEKIGNIVFESTGATYAGLFEFPTLFGPDCYLSGVSSIPSGMSSLINETYSTRITQWRDNCWAGFSPKQGYFREIYPINFLFESHITATFNNKPLVHYMEKFGILSKSNFNNMYRWDIPEKNLDQVRIDLEKSGLILSASTPVKRKN